MHNSSQRTATVFVRTLLSALVLMIISGCATLDEGECNAANWYVLGEQDGNAGKTVGQLDTYRQDCAEYGIQVNREDYTAGWQAGIQNFCTRDNGFRAGVDGVIYEDSCPLEVRDTFFNSYQIGRAIYRARADADALRYEIESLGDRLAESDLSNERRRTLRKERERYQDDLVDAEWAIDEALEDARRNGL